MKISTADLYELKGLKNPPQAVINTFYALAQLFASVDRDLPVDKNGEIYCKGGFNSVGWFRHFTTNTNHAL